MKRENIKTHTVILLLILTGGLSLHGQQIFENGERQPFNIPVETGQIWQPLKDLGPGLPPPPPGGYVGGPVTDACWLMVALAVGYGMLCRRRKANV